MLLGIMSIVSRMADWAPSRQKAKAQPASVYDGSNPCRGPTLSRLAPRSSPVPLSASRGTVPFAQPLYPPPWDWSRTSQPEGNLRARCDTTRGPGLAPAAVPSGSVLFATSEVDDGASKRRYTSAAWMMEDATDASGWIGTG